MSRASQISKGQSLKARAALAEKVNAEAAANAKKEEQEKAAAVVEVTDAKPEEKQPDEEQKDPEAVELDAATATGDQKDQAEIEVVSVAGSAAFDAVSVIPPSQVATEVLEEEYKKLLEEYESIAAENKNLED